MTPEARGIALFCAALLAATVMDALVKLASDRFSTAEILVWRSVGAAPFILALAALGPGLRAVVPSSWRFVLLRGAVLAGGTGLFFWSLRGLDLATAYVVTYTLPLVMTVLAVLILGERAPAARWAAVAVGFAGVGIAAAPRFLDGAALSLDLHALAAFGGTVLFALAMLMVRMAKGAETTEALVFWGLAAMAALAVPLAAAEGWRGPAAEDLPVLLGIALTAAASQATATAAFAMTEASRLAPFLYTTLLWGIVLDLALWGAPPSAATLAGAAVVAAAALVAGRRET